MNISVTKIFPFEMAHALLEYDGDCKNIHGHSYKLHISISGEILNKQGHPKNGMVLDFKDLKSIVKSKVLDTFDHAIVLNEHYSESLKTALLGHFKKVVFTSYQPTCELLLVNFINLIKEELPENLVLQKARLYETESCYAEWSKE